MDLSSIMSTLLAGDSVDTMSETTKTDSGQVQNVLSAALPMLMKGLAQQTTDSKTKASAAAALEKHAQSDTSDLASFLKGVDTDDGAKILSHLLGQNTDSTTENIAKKSGVSASQVATILSTAAPLLMSLVGQQATAAKKSSAKKTTAAKKTTSSKKTAAAKDDDNGFDIGDLVSGMLGGGSGSGSSDMLSAAGGLLGKLLK